MANQRSKFLTRCRAAFADLNPDAQILDDEVWEESLTDALGELSEWRPTRTLTELQIIANKYDYALPSNFREIDVESFNQSVNPTGLTFVHSRGVLFELGYTESGRSGNVGLPWNPFAAFTPPYGSPTSVRFGLSFAPCTRFEFADKVDAVTGLVSKVMYVSPAPLESGIMKFLYLGTHTLTDDTGSGEDQVVGVNSVQPEDRDLLVALTCHYSCQAMQRRTASHKQYAVNFRRLAEQYRARFDARTRNMLITAE